MAWQVEVESLLFGDDGETDIMQLLKAGVILFNGRLVRGLPRQLPLPATESQAVKKRRSAHKRHVPHMYRKGISEK